MDPKVYTELSAVEDKHWWFVGRRAICADLIQRLNMTHAASILEAGCGSGGNLPMLATFGQVSAFELYDAARQKAAARNIGVVEKGSLPDAIPFSQNFDLIVMTDVLEHVEDDMGALKALHARLNDNGALLITVPAFPSLWSKHDELHHHKRRYTKRELKRVLNEASFAPTTLSYFNFFLFPMVAIIRFAERFLPEGKESYGGHMPPKQINRLLGHLFKFERFFVSRGAMPFGVSLVVVARKR